MDEFSDTAEAEESTDLAPDAASDTGGDVAELDEDVEGDFDSDIVDFDGMDVLGEDVWENPGGPSDAGGLELEPLDVLEEDVDGGTDASGDALREMVDEYERGAWGDDDGPQKVLTR